MSESRQGQPVGGVGNMNREHFRDVVENEFGGDVPKPIEVLLDKDFPLSKITSDDRRYLRLKAKNVMDFVEEQYPPEDSILQGDVRAALLEDPEDTKDALTAADKAKIQSILLSYFSRVSRGQGGWQQDKLNEGIQTQRVEDVRGGEDGSDSLIKGWF